MTESADSAAADAAPADAAPAALAALRRRAARRLELAGFDAPRGEADALLAAVLGRSRGELEVDALMGRGLDPAQAAAVERALARRARREPLQHLVGRAPFWDVELAVGPGAFVPRPETELLVELAAAELRARIAAGDDHPLAADLGSGTGAVAIGLARAVPQARVIALEGSAAAWPWLIRNVREHTGPEHGAGVVEPRFGRIGEAPLARLGEGERLSILVSNPPYIPARNAPREPEARDADPATALYGGEDGLDVIRLIERIGRAELVPGAALLLEHDDHQGPEVRALLEAAGWLEAETRRDLAGRDRVTLARLPGGLPTEGSRPAR
ncbi:Release factor glutamine methyltransferase [Pseudoclavibacter triregionum]|nr:Release factor glutamine methyltransferase [Pseudoclavibacter triregionum]